MSSRTNTPVLLGLSPSITQWLKEEQSRQGRSGSIIVEEILERERREREQVPARRPKKVASR